MDSIRDRLLELARQKQSAAQVSEESEKLRPLEYGGARDQFARGRVVELFFKGVVPLVIVAWVLSTVFGCNKSSVNASVPATVVKPSVVVTRVVTTDPGSGQAVGSGMFGTTDYSFNYGQTPQAVRGTSAPVLDVRVKCYAVRDVTSVYSSTKVLENGLFLAERYTRVQGGMIFNSKFGWYKFSDFGCQPGVERLEVEFVLPPATLTPRPVIRLTSTSVSVIQTVVPLPTLRTGIISFSAEACRLTWLVWDVQAVYLYYGGKRESVAGDRSGKSVDFDLVPCVPGLVRLEAVARGGEKYIREIQVQGK